MGVITLEGIVEDGQFGLPATDRLLERTRVYVVIPGGKFQPLSTIGSPRLVHPEQAAGLKKGMVE